MDNILRLIGLAQRGGNLAAGEEPVGGTARARDARIILVAKDTADNTRRRVRHFADAGQCLWISVPYGKDELGRCIGRASCAMLAITDVGLANAVVQKLAEQDRETYGITAEKMALKAQRAEERRAEAKQHEKNLRLGKKKLSPAPSDTKPEASRIEVRTAKKTAEHGRKPFRHSVPASKHPANRFAHSRPVKKGKGSKKTGSANMKNQ